MKKTIASFVLRKLVAGLLALPIYGPISSRRKTLQAGGKTRAYYLHVPDHAPQDKVWPLVLIFHGNTCTPNYIERDTRFSELADREGFIAVYPEGIERSWNDGRSGDDVMAKRQNIDDVGFVSTLIDDIGKSYRINPKAIFATGFSNGAIFSQFQYLALKLSNRIAAIATVAGGIAQAIADSFNPSQPVSVMVFQSTTDPIVPYAGGDITVPGITRHAGIIPTDETINKWVAFNQCRQEPLIEKLPDLDPSDGCSETKYTYANGKNGTEVVLYRISGGGHTWPGGIQYLPKKFIGPVCRDLNATASIWEFFKTHRKP